MKNWKVGSITAGVMFILIGACWFLKSFVSLPYPTLLFNIWPIACIFLGIEILSFQIFRKEESLRFHGLSIFLLVLILLLSISFSFLTVFYETQFSL